MNVAVTFPAQARRAASPYARRLARERKVALDDMAGSGPDGRILAADVLAYQAPVAETPPAPAITPPSAPPPAPVFTFSATVSLTNLYHLAAEAARVGLEIAVEDAAWRAATMALAGIAGGIAFEADGRQILISSVSGLSIGAERRMRLATLENRTDMSADPAAASLLVLHSGRVVPVTLPLLPARAFRLALFVDMGNAQGHALLCADGNLMTEARAVAVLEAFADSLERPLLLLA